MNAVDTMISLMKRYFEQIAGLDRGALIRTVGMVALFVVVLVAANFYAPQRSGLLQATVVPVSQEFELRVDEAEVLWLARGIYSETKEPHEQELVAWSVRNRVETGYRNQHSYRDVVLDPWQYSAFNENSPKRDHYMSLTEQSQEPGWQKALEIAERVANAPAEARPFSQTTRHFYSERSMVGGSTPDWAVNLEPEALDRYVDPERFRFFADVA